MAPTRKKPAPRKAVTKGASERSASHMVNSASQDFAHGVRHVSAARRAKTLAAAKFELDHATPHLKGAAAGIRDLGSHLSKNPGVAKETKALKKANPVKRTR